ncbi:MAG: hypothetical protein MUP98_00525 [Candidatus Aminicenantes bacterium]|nr:hypothetical protein [Candidatus Aminicenantes bacterium]
MRKGLSLALFLVLAHTVLVVAVVFKMSKGAFLVYPDKENPKDIHFEYVSGIEKIPGEQLELREEIDRVLVVLRALFPNENDINFNEYFRPLLSLAQAGLVGENAQPKLAKGALDALKNEILAREAGRVKNKYMKNLGKKAFLFGGLPLFIGLIFYWIAPQLRLLWTYLLLWAGCMAGVWLSFGARKADYRFEDLHIPEKDRLEPSVRLVFSGLISIIFGLLFATGAIEMKVGGILLSNFISNFQIALLLGMILGFSETTLPSALASKASSFIRRG